MWVVLYTVPLFSKEMLDLVLREMLFFLTMVGEETNSELDIASLSETLLM